MNWGGLFSPPNDLKPLDALSAAVQLMQTMPTQLVTYRVIPQNNWRRRCVFHMLGGTAQDLQLVWMAKLKYGELEVYKVHEEKTSNLSRQHGCFSCRLRLKQTRRRPR